MKLRVGKKYTVIGEQVDLLEFGRHTIVPAVIDRHPHVIVIDDEVKHYSNTDVVVEKTIATTRPLFVMGDNVYESFVEDGKLVLKKFDKKVFFWDSCNGAVWYMNGFIQVMDNMICEMDVEVDVFRLICGSRPAILHRNDIPIVVLSMADDNIIYVNIENKTLVRLGRYCKQTNEIASYPFIDDDDDGVYDLSTLMIMKYNWRNNVEDTNYDGLEVFKHKGVVVLSNEKLKELKKERLKYKHEGVCLEFDRLEVDLLIEGDYTMKFYPKLMYVDDGRVYFVGRDSLSSIYLPMEVVIDSEGGEVYAEKIEMEEVSTVSKN